VLSDGNKQTSYPIIITVTNAPPIFTSSVVNSGAISLKLNSTYYLQLPKVNDPDGIE
jgi:hypothetical protein